VDDTGNRRFWPVKCGKIDLAALRRDRDQLWAEAVYRLHKGESYELPGPLWAEAARVQQDRTLTSPWTERLEVALEGKRGNIDVEMVYEFLGLKVDRQNKYVAAQVRKSMDDIGWTKARRRRGNKQVYCYTNLPEHENDGKWIALYETTTIRRDPTVLGQSRL
jgi:predicted P-loop ATPase